VLKLETKLQKKLSHKTIQQSLNNKVGELKTSVRAAPPVHSMWPSKTKLDEEKSKHAGLAQHNGFGWPCRILSTVKGTAEPNTCCLIG
jgi:hypothetical protein